MIRSRGRSQRQGMCNGLVQLPPTGKGKASRVIRGARLGTGKAGGRIVQATWRNGSNMMGPQTTRARPATAARGPTARVTGGSCIEATGATIRRTCDPPVALTPWAPLASGPFTTVAVSPGVMRPPRLTTDQGMSFPPIVPERLAPAACKALGRTLLSCMWQPVRDTT